MKFISLLFIVVGLAFIQKSEAQVPSPQSNAVFEFEKENTLKKYPGTKLLIDLKPGQSCYTNPWAFVESFPCAPAPFGTVTAKAVNRNGALYIIKDEEEDPVGVELKNNRAKR